MSELSKKEIRIGNYLISKMMGVLQVQMIPIDIDMSNYEHIPLTQEWLMDFGFVFKNNVWFFENLELEEFTTNKHFVFNFINNYKNYAIGGRKLIANVHELQNLYFALTGKELTHKKIN